MNKHVELLKEVEQALNDWIVSYAPEFCTKKDVIETTVRIRSNGGTMSYITELRERVEFARKEMEK